MSGSINNINVLNNFGIPNNELRSLDFIISPHILIRHFFLPINKIKFWSHMLKV